MARQIVVEIVGDSTKFTAAVDKASGKSKAFNSVLMGIGAGFGISTVGVITKGIGMVTDFIGDSIRRANDYQQALGTLNVVFGESGQVIQDWATKAADAAGLSSTEVFSAANVMGSALQNMGFSAGESAGLVVDLQQRAADMAAQFNGDTSDALEAIASLFRGERDPIEKYGVAIKQSDINARLAAQGLSHLEGKARRQAEAQAALELLFRQTTKAQGAFRREADSLTGSQQRANAKFEEASRKLGEKLLPIATAVMTWIADEFIPGLIEWGDRIAWVGDKVGQLAQWIGEKFAWIRDKFLDFIDWLRGMPGRIAGAVRGMWDSISTGFKNAINQIIRGWNSLEFTVPSIDLGPLGKVGGFTIGVPDIPYLHQGGTVPGVPGSDVLAMLQAGERVIPRNQVGMTGGGISIHIENFTGSDSDIDRLADRLAHRLRLQGAF